MTIIWIGGIRVVFNKSEVVSDFDAIVVVLFSANRLVLVRNEERAWEFPGGHREGDESYRDTAEREVYEETGARVSAVEYLGYYTSSHGKVTVIVCAEVDSNEWTHENIDPPRVGVFEHLPPALSFGDGREQFFVDAASAFISSDKEKLR